MAEVTLWHEEKKTADWTEYYVVLADGEQTISFILAHNAKTKEVRADPYSPPDINYTIHDGCDHDEDHCVLDDPDSEESKDVLMCQHHHYAVQNVSKLEAQVRQRRIAETLHAKLREKLGHIGALTSEEDEDGNEQGRH